MAKLDIFENDEVVSEKKPEVIDNDNFDFFNVSEQQDNDNIKKIDTFDDFILNIKNKPEEQCSYKWIDTPAYFGKTFEFLGYWKEDTTYYNSDYIQSFVSCDNCLLACLITHRSTNSIKPIIYKDPVSGMPTSVIDQYGNSSAYWFIVMTGYSSEENYADLINKIQEFQDKLNEISNINTTQNTAIKGISDRIIEVGNDVKDLSKISEEHNKQIKEISDKISGDISYPWIGSEEEYDSLTEKDSNKFYYLYEE